MKQKILLSHFKGILIYLQKEISEADKQIDFHIIVKYWNSNGSAVYDFNGKFISGDTLPENQEKLLQAWFVLRAEEIQSAQIAWIEDKEIIRIDGLK